MSNSNIKEILLEGNLLFQEKLFEGLEEIDSEKSFPRYPVLILTCMDSRIDIHRIFQLEPGDVMVLRNAGNIFTKDVLRALLIAIYKYNIDTVIVLGHTDCGMTKLDMQELKNELMPDALLHITKVHSNDLLKLREFFIPFIDEFKNIKDQIELLKRFKGFPIDINFIGMIYEVATGWVFDMDKLQHLDYIEEFQFNLEDLIEEKHQKLVDFLEPDEPDKHEIKNARANQTEKIIKLKGLLSKKSNSENENLEESTSQDWDPIGEFPMIDIETPTFSSKINIPKVRFPKIKVRIPNIYRKSKEKI